MRQCTYNGTLLCIHVTIVAMETALCCLCVVEPYVTVGDIKLLSVAIERLNLIPCALSVYKIFCTDVNSTNVGRSSYKVLSSFDQMCSFSADIYKILWYKIS
jgi:hypothetical protein